jgi:transposase
MSSNRKGKKIKSKNLDHLGLVAGMYDELGIGDVIDDTIEQDSEKRKVSLGQAVKAMVLNGLGFVNQRLYLFPKFFEDKPVDRLIGKGICASDLNEHVMVWSLDDIYEQFVPSLYSQISVNATQVLGLKCQTGHLDSTSFHTDGIYETAQNEKASNFDPDLITSTNNQNVGNQGSRFGSHD